jgi:hypothetical protein
MEKRKIVLFTSEGEFFNLLWLVGDSFIILEKENEKKRGYVKGMIICVSQKVKDQHNTLEVGTLYVYSRDSCQYVL